jgi:FixJ family two-component response regulator
VVEHKTTVYIVDDDEAVAGSLAAMIRSDGFAVETYASPKGFLAAFRSSGPCCLILDLRMPGSSGLDLQSRLSDTGIEVPIIFLTGFGSVYASVRAMKAGAFDFLEKPVKMRTLLDAVRRAVERSARVALEQADLDEIRRRAATLTPRERDVFARVVTGAPNKLIAAVLETSEITIKVHRSRVMKKMRAASFADLVRMAIRLGLHSSKESAPR